MDRTGIIPGAEALELYRTFAALPSLSAAGVARGYG